MNSIYSNFQGFLEKSNFIFAFWSLFIMVIIVFSFAYFKKKELFFFGNKKAPIAKNTNYTENKRQPNYTSNSKINTLNAKDNESYSLWLNNYLEWSYIHCEHAKKINSFLLKSLIDSKETIATNTSDEDFLFISVESSPPKLSNLHNVNNGTDNFTLKSNVEFDSIDIVIQYKNKKLQPQQRLLEPKLANLSGQLNIILTQNKSVNESLSLEICFDKNTDIKFQIQDEKLSLLNSTSIKTLDSIVKNALRQANLKLDLNINSKQSTLNYATNSNLSKNAQYSPTYKTSQGLTRDLLESSASNPAVIKEHNDLTGHNVNLNSSGDKRLMVKLLKAANLNNCEEPFCVIELDNPLQKQITNVFKDTSALNEQFLFDITNFSEELIFSIYDRNKDYANDLMGEAVLPVSDLCSNLASKRIIQLHKYGTTKTGSLTAEFMFIEPITTNSSSKQNSFKGNNNIRNSFDLTNKQFLTQRNDDIINNANSSYSPHSKSYDASDMTLTPISHGTEQSMNHQNLLGFNKPYHQSNIYDTTSSPNNEKFNQNPTDDIRKNINRNYLHVKPSQNNSTPLAASITNSLVNSNGNVHGIVGENSSKAIDAKRTRSISRSLRSLFIRTSNSDKKKRDPSTDSRNTYNTYNSTVQQEVQSEINFKKQKTFSGSLKRIFSRKKSSKANTIGNNNETISYSASRQIKLIDQHSINTHQATLAYELSEKLNQQDQEAKHFKEDITYTAFRKEPLTLRKNFRVM